MEHKSTTNMPGRGLAASWLALPLAACVLFAASVADAQRIRVRVAPPAAREEAQGTARWTGAIWQPGYWTWTGRSWTWRRGRWIRARRFGWEYSPPRWVDRGGYWVYVPARWHRRPGWRTREGAVVPVVVPPRRRRRVVVVPDRRPPPPGVIVPRRHRRRPPPP